MNTKTLNHITDRKDSEFLSRVQMHAEMLRSIDGNEQMTDYQVMPIAEGLAHRDQALEDLGQVYWKLENNMRVKCLIFWATGVVSTMLFAALFIPGIMSI